MFYLTAMFHLSASWDPSLEDSVEAPQLNGARWFSYDELKNCTNDFPDINIIGRGGYGKVTKFVWSSPLKVERKSGERKKILQKQSYFILCKLREVPLQF